MSKPGFRLDLVAATPEVVTPIGIAAGFWNPFGLAFDAAGNLFGSDNDPDARGPNRILHLVRGGDYGYRALRAKSGLHPFQPWNGELPGTLPFVCGVGESPGTLVSCDFAPGFNPTDSKRPRMSSKEIGARPESAGNPPGRLLVAIWAEERIDRVVLMRRGRRMFLSPQLGCAKCHVAEGRGAAPGPDLSAVGRGMSRARTLAGPA